MAVLTTYGTSAPLPPEITGSRVALVIHLNIALFVFTTIVVGLRVFARLYIRNYFGADDYLICLGAVAAFGLGSLAIVGTHYGLGLHSHEIHNFASKQVPYLKVIFAGSILYIFPMMFTKLSILVFYLRLQPRAAASPGFRASVYSLMVFVISVSIASWFAIAFECSPIAYTWDLSLNGTCTDRTVFYYFQSALNIFSDFAVYFMAIPLVRAVKLSKRQRRGLYMVMCLGCFVCIAAIIRMVTIHKINHTVDSTWVLVDPFNWSVVEAHSGILSACIPSFKIIISHYWPKCLGKESSTRDTQGNVIGLPKRDSLFRIREPPNYQTGMGIRDFAIGEDAYKHTRTLPPDMNIESFQGCDGSQEQIINPGPDNQP